MVCPPKPVQEDWIDYNGHMNMAYYHVVFDAGVDFAYDSLGIGADYVQQGGSCFTREVHVNYLSELNLGDVATVTWQLLDCDAKRLHFFEHMYRGDVSNLAANTEGQATALAQLELVATSEQMALHVDMRSRRTAPFPSAIGHKIQELMERHANLPKPEQVGQVMQIRRR